MGEEGAAMTGAGITLLLSIALSICVGLVAVTYMTVHEARTSWEDVRIVIDEVNRTRDTLTIGTTRLGDIYEKGARK